MQYNSEIVTEFNNNKQFVLQKQILDLLERDNIKLSDRIPQIKKEEIANTVDIPYEKIDRILNKSREETGEYPNYCKDGLVEIKRPIITPLFLDCLDKNLTRDSPKTELTACKKMIKTIIDMPFGGGGLLIGTPTAHSACGNLKTRNYAVCDDNLEVAIMLKNMTEDRLEVIIGNLIDKKKAILKAQYWKSNGSMRCCKICVAPVDSYHYELFVKRLAERQKSKNKIAKVYLLTSGVWSNSLSTQNTYYKKYKKFFNFDFKTPSIKLTNEYDNLHIVAMTRECDFQYNVKYLHQGKIEIID